MRKRKKIEPEELLAAIAEAVDDGFYQAYLALTSEGWRALRSSRTFSPSMNQTRRPSG